MFDLAKRHRITRLFARQFFHQKIRRKINADRSRFVFFLTDDLLAKLWQKVIRRELQPEFFPALQILARVRCGFRDRFAVNRSFKIDDREIFHLRRALWNVDEIGRLIAQALESRVDLRLGDFGVRQFDRDIFIIRQFEFRRSDDRGLIPH